MQIYKLFLCVIPYAQLLNVVQSGHLDGFIQQKNSNFSTWLKLNNMDPSPLISGPVPIEINTPFTHMNFNLTNYGVRGHSDGINFLTEKAYLFPYGESDSSSFTSSFYVDGNVTYYGEYNADGTIFSNVSVSGSGKWQISLPQILVASCRCIFELLPSGPIQSHPCSVRDIYFQTEWLDIYFENIWESQEVEPFKELIKEVVFANFPVHFSKDELEPLDPVGKAYLQFWREILTETTLQDILNSPILPDVHCEIQ